MDNLAPGSQLAQTSPSATTATTAFTATLNTEITRIHAVNYTGSAVDCEVYHDDDGTTYNNTTIVEKFSAPANSTTEKDYRSGGNGLSVRPNGTIGIKAGTANAVNFTLYGTVQRGR